jgi:hypothetical protein
MKQQLRFYNSLLLSLGLDLKKFLYFFRGLPSYFKDLRVLKSQQKSSSKRFDFGQPILCLDDRFAESGSINGHYFYQDWLVANRIFQNNPEIHVDAGSRVDGFVAHVASFRSIRVIDIRPLKNRIPQIDFVSADLMQPLKDDLIGCCDSLSCLHTLEHFGLGRYGDPVNYDGYLIGLDNLSDLLKTNGKFYLSVPIGPQRIEFNGHRVFSCSYLLELFDKKFKIDNFSFVDDGGDLHINTPLNNESVSNNFGCTYGCGIFEMTKI